MESGFDYTVTTAKEFDAAAKSAEEAVVKAGMRVLHIHDVQRALGEKGFARAPFKIIEFCNARYASAFLEADMRLGLCMPCKVNVYVKDGTTVISGMRPVVLRHFFPKAELGSLPEEIDALVRTIVDTAAQ